MRKPGKQTQKKTRSLRASKVPLVTPNKAAKGETKTVSEPGKKGRNIYTVFFAASGSLVKKTTKKECENLVNGLGGTAIDLGVEVKIFGSNDDFITFKESLKNPNGPKVDDAVTCVKKQEAQDQVVVKDAFDKMADKKRASLNDSVETKTKKRIAEQDLMEVTDGDGIPDYNLSENTETLPEATQIADKDGISSLLAKKYQQNISKRGMNMVIHTFPTVPESASIQPIILDFVDQKPWTHWCHRASTWSQVMHYICQEGVVTNKFLKKLRCINGTKKNLYDTVETYQVKSSSGSNIKLQRQLLIGYIRNGMDDCDILSAVEKFLKPLYTNKDIMQCYFVSAMGTTDS